MTDGYYKLPEGRRWVRLGEALGTRGIGDAVNLLTLSFKVTFRVSERYGNWG